VYANFEADIYTNTWPADGAILLATARPPHHHSISISISITITHRHGTAHILAHTLRRYSSQLKAEPSFLAAHTHSAGHENSTEMKG